MEWGIFTDESSDYTAEEALEAGFLSQASAEARIAEAYPDDNAFAHPVEDNEED